MHKFKAVIEIIGINPFVTVPEEILRQVFKQAGKDKGHIPIRGCINDKPYKQTLLRYSGKWRLYINTSMLRESPKRIGEIIELTIGVDDETREIEPPEMLMKALDAHPEALAVFNTLNASTKKEIIRYLVNLKGKEAKERNLEKAINFLLGKGKFIGRMM